MLRPPRPAGAAADGHGGLAAGQQHGGWGQRLAVQGDAMGDAGEQDAGLGGLAFQRVAEDQRGQAEAAGGVRHVAHRDHRRGDQAEIAVRQLAGFRRLVGRCGEAVGGGGGGRDAVAGDDLARVGEGGGVGHGGAGGDHRRVVTRHVADCQGDHTGGRGGSGQPAALDRREVFAHAVHFGDRRPGGAAARG